MSVTDAEQGGYSLTYVPAVATLEDRLAGRVSTPAGVRVTHASGWALAWREGEPTAAILDPSGERVGAAVVEHPGEYPPRTQQLTGLLRDYLTART